MSQFLNPLDHFRVVKAWAEIANAQVTLDVKSFELEVKCRNRYYCLKPRFFYKVGGRMGYTVQMVKATSGFIGWLPYDLYQSELAQDKLLAKAFFKAAGLNSPATLPSLDMADDDFLTKSSSGSFGYQISGPYRRGTSTSAVSETIATIKAATLSMMLILELVIEEGGEIERNLGYGRA